MILGHTYSLRRAENLRSQTIRPSLQLLMMKLMPDSRYLRGFESFSMAVHFPPRKLAHCSDETFFHVVGKILDIRDVF